MEKDRWVLLSAESEAVLPSRWRVFWNYIIRRKSLSYRLEGYVEPITHGITRVQLRLYWRKRNESSSQPIRKSSNGIRVNPTKN